MKAESDKTHFGYTEIPVSEKTARVTQVFDSVVNKYDLMNDVLSFGLHRCWKQLAISAFANIRNGHVVLDLAGGTGDLTKALAKKVGKEGRVVLADINFNMLDLGRDKLIDVGLINNISYTQVNAESLPFQENTFDCITIAFGLRNVTRIDKALASMQRILKPGGSLIILEFSTPTLPVLKSLYDLYSFNVIPWLGEKIAADKKSYQYLVESIRKHPNQIKLQEMMETAGFDDCQYFNLTGGIVAVHRGYKY